MISRLNKKILNGNFQSENKEKQIQLAQLMENQKELEKTSSECWTENSRLKTKRSFRSTKCRKLHSTENVTWPIKAMILTIKLNALKVFCRKHKKCFTKG